MRIRGTVSGVAPVGGCCGGLRGVDGNGEGVVGFAAGDVLDGSGRIVAGSKPELDVCFIGEPIKHSLMSVVVHLWDAQEIL